MSTSAGVQLILGFCAAVAAYLLLVVYNGGRIELDRLELVNPSEPAAAPGQPSGSAPAQSQ